MSIAAELIDKLETLGDLSKAAEMAAYHKVPRPYLGVANPVLDGLATPLRREMDVDARVALASDLWSTNTHEARILATKLLMQARLRADDTLAWDLIVSWVPDFDAWAIADHACMAGQKRLVWQPARLNTVEGWTTSDHMWTRRAALVMTLPWTKQNHPKPAELEARHRILGWAARYVSDHDWFIQKAIGWWLREVSKHDPQTTRDFIDTYGDQMKPFARKEALRKLPAL